MDVRAKKGKKIIIIVLAAVLAAAAAAAAFIYLKNAGSKQEEKEEVHNLFNCGLLPVKSGDKCRVHIVKSEYRPYELLLR